jgi:hypothetical protein
MSRQSHALPLPQLTRTVSWPPETIICAPSPAYKRPPFLNGKIHTTFLYLVDIVSRCLASWFELAGAGRAPGRPDVPSVPAFPSSHRLDEVDEEKLLRRTATRRRLPCLPRRASRRSSRRRPPPRPPRRPGEPGHPTTCCWFQTITEELRRYPASSASTAVSPGELPGQRRFLSVARNDPTSASLFSNVCTVIKACTFCLSHRVSSRPLDVNPAVAYPFEVLSNTDGWAPHVRQHFFSLLPARCSVDRPTCLHPVGPLRISPHSFFFKKSI